MVPEPITAMFFMKICIFEGKDRNPEVKKTRPIRLSSRWLGPWKHFTFAIYLAFMIAVSFSFLHDANSGGEWLMGIGMSGLYAFGVVALWRISGKLQQLSFDDRFAYVQMKGHELLIPLENIKDVELKTILGTYEVMLHHPEQFGRSFFFKISLLHPLNHKRKEELVDRFWEAVEKAKRHREVLRPNTLLS